VLCSGAVAIRKLWSAALPTQCREKRVSRLLRTPARLATGSPPWPE